MVRGLYVVPRDRTPNSAHVAAMQNALNVLQSWFRDQLGGRTFALYAPQPETCMLPRPADYYAVDSWTKIVNDAQECASVAYAPSPFVWVVYADLRHACGAPGRLGAGAPGLTIMGRGDLEGLLGLPVVMGDCGPELPYPIGRYIGGMGHELGHAFGLPHPPGCDQGLPSCDFTALMGAGFYDFPRTPYLRSDDKAALLNSPNLRNNSPAPCTFEIGSNGANLNAGGGGGTVSINTSPGCAWSAATEVNWLALANGASRSGPGSLEFTATLNPGPARAAAIYIANKTYIVTQPAGAATQTPENALILSQFVSGPEWNSTLVLNNLSNQAENFTLSFYDDDGRAKLMPIVGLGLVHSIAGSLKAKETRRFQTAQLGDQLVAWGLLTPGTPATQRLSGLAVLRQTVPKEQTLVSSEASVDLVPITESRYVALYDNTNDFDTAFAVANPDAFNPIEILIESRDEAGVALGIDTIRLPPLGHTAFVLRTRLASTQVRRGSVRFQSSPRGFGGLGLRFSPFQTFTSFRLLTSRDIQ